jgi:hypothetical protein
LETTVAQAVLQMACSNQLQAMRNNQIPATGCVVWSTGTTPADVPNGNMRRAEIQIIKVLENRLDTR